MYCSGTNGYFNRIFKKKYKQCIYRCHNSQSKFLKKDRFYICYTTNIKVLFFFNPTTKKEEKIMSKMAKVVKEQRKTHDSKAVVNYMGGTSYELSPLETLKMVSASSIFGEPQYYRTGEFSQKGVSDGTFHINSLFQPYSLFDEEWNNTTTSDFMEEIIDKALDDDFEGTIKWANTLRNEYNMRLNPQVIMVRAAMHEKRPEFNKNHPGLFSEINKKVMARADEPSAQLTYYLYTNQDKSSIPNILKRNWANRIENSSRYELAKYKNHNVGLIDTVRISHAQNADIDELMKSGTIAVAENEKTWENLRSAGEPWKDILQKCNVPHMALLRNLRGIFTEIDDLDTCTQVTDKLIAGVPKGKQFPFRYFAAYNTINKSDSINHKGVLKDALEKCIDVSCDNMPRLKGKTMCLSDNSGSAWGTCQSEYGTMTVAEIDNLSSIITARNSDEGYIGIFGDKLLTYPVSKRDGVLSQTQNVSKHRTYQVGGATENGIWLFFKKAINEKEHWDNIFIYSDQQAGHGGLYGTDEEKHIYKDLGFGCKNSDKSWYAFDTSDYIDVAKLIDTYRKEVNPNVNVFSIQTAGYNNAVIPEYGYRTNIMYGWTGKESIFAKNMIDLWDETDAHHNFTPQQQKQTIKETEQTKSEQKSVTNHGEKDIKTRGEKASDKFGHLIENDDELIDDMYSKFGL